MSTTNWSDVKHDPTLRTVYHNDNFQELVNSAEELSRSILTKATSIEDKAVANTLRLVLDGMVKCFDQFYYDVNSGFPGYKPAIWESVTSVNMKVTQAELYMLCEALEYAKEQVSSSHIPVFEVYTNNDAVNIEEACIAVDTLVDKIMIISQNDEGSLILSD